MLIAGDENVLFGKFGDGKSAARLMHANFQCAEDFRCSILIHAGDQRPFHGRDERTVGCRLSAIGDVRRLEAQSRKPRATAAH